MYTCKYLITIVNRRCESLRSSSLTLVAPSAQAAQINAPEDNPARAMTDPWEAREWPGQAAARQRGRAASPEGGLPAPQREVFLRQPHTPTPSPAPGTVSASPAVTPRSTHPLQKAALPQAPHVPVRPQPSATGWSRTPKSTSRSPPPQPAFGHAYAKIPPPGPTSAPPPATPYPTTSRFTSGVPSSASPAATAPKSEKTLCQDLQVPLG